MTSTPPPVSVPLPTDGARGIAWVQGGAVTALLAVGGALGALWLAPAALDRGQVAGLAAVAGGVCGAALATALAARRTLSRREWEWRRGEALAAWQADAARDDSLDDDPLDGDPLDAGAPDGAAPGPSAAALLAALAMVEDAVVVLDADGWVTAANPAATARLGAAAAPESRWDETVAWPDPLVAERRALPGGGALIVARDPLRERLRAAQTDALDGLVDLAGTIVHDVNNALGAVAGYADFLVADLPDGSPQADYALRILRATDRSKTMLRGMVAAARTPPPDLRPADSAGILSDAAAQLRERLPPGACLSVREDPDLPGFLGDAALLARTLVGLADEIVGAAGAEGADGGLSLRAASWPGAADATAAPAGWRVLGPLWPRRADHVVFELRSKAPPRAPAAWRAAFNPVLAARERARQGDGNPSPSPVSVARWHEGGLVVLTHPVEGTVVRLFVPVADEVGSAPAAPESAAPWHVLVVEDDAAMGDLLSAGLERLGSEVAVCESAADALEIVVDEPAFFDVVIVGPLAGGGMAGPALISRLKALRPDLPCVHYRDPAKGEAPDPVNAPPAGSPLVGALAADLVLSTPLDIDALSGAVAALATIRRHPPGATIRRHPPGAGS